jgi:hypothetical protein
MIAVIIPVHEFSRAEQAYESLRSAHIVLEAELNELAEQPRHAISHESMIIAQKTEVLNHIERAMANLVKLSEIANDGFATKSEINQAISASQPYNTGSRENY